MFNKLEKINSRPKPFQFYTAKELWTYEHTSKKMLDYHLNKSMDLASRKDEFINRSVDWILNHFQISSNTSIADFGCGPGLYTTLFAENGADVTGIDFSAESIKYARKMANEKGLKVSYYKQNYLEFKTDKRFDLITMIFCDYCALSPKQRELILLKFYSFLKPGGLILLDVHSIEAFNKIKEVATYEYNQLDNFWSQKNYYGFLNTFRYPEEKVSLDKYTIIEKSKTRVVYNWLQYFSKDSLRKEFEKNGFSAEEFYSDVAGTTFSPDSPEIAIVARK